MRAHGLQLVVAALAGCGRIGFDVAASDAEPAVPCPADVRLDAASAAAPAIEARGDRFGAAYVAADGNLRLALVEPDHTYAAVLVATVPASVTKLAVAATPSGFVVAWFDGEIVLAIVDGTQRLIVRPPMPKPPSPRFDLAASDTALMLAWEPADATDIHVTRLSFAGAVGNTVVLPTPDLSRDPSIGFEGAFVVAWTDDRTPSAIFSARVTDDEVPDRGIPVELSEGRPAGTRPVVRGVEDRYLVAWLEDEATARQIVTRALGLTGAPLEVAHTLTSDPAWNVNVDVAASAARVGLVRGLEANDPTGAGDNVHFVELERYGKPRGEPIEIGRPAGDAVLPAIAIGDAGTRVIQTERRTEDPRNMFYLICVDQ